MGDEEKKREDDAIGIKNEETDEIHAPPSSNNLITGGSASAGEEENYESADENNENVDKSNAQNLAEVSKDEPGNELDSAGVFHEAADVKEKNDVEKKPKGTDEDAASTASSQDGQKREHDVSRRRSEASEEGDQKRESVDDKGHEETASDEDQRSDENETEEQEQEKTEKETEDRRNPAYVPRRGQFFQHDTRLSDEPETNKAAGRQTKKQVMMEKQGRWQHDMFDESQQKPKSAQELINIYGYDIRNESKAPRDPHGRRYGRTQNTDRARRGFGGYRGRGGGFAPSGRRDRNRPSEEDDQQQRQQRAPPPPPPIPHQSRSTSPPPVDDTRNKDVDSTRPVNQSSANVDVSRSRSFSDRENVRPYNNSYRGRQAGPGVQRAPYGTVEFRRRGRGTAFASNQRYGGNRYQKNYDGQYGYSEHGDYPASSQQLSSKTQRPQHEGPRMSKAYYQRSRDNESGEAMDERREHQRQSPSNDGAASNRRQQHQHQQQSWDQKNANASTKRYSATRQQQVQPQPPANAQKAPPDGASTNSLTYQQCGPVATPMMTQPHAEQATPMYAAPPPPHAVHYPPFFNGSAIYHQQTAVAVPPDMYQMPVPFSDGAAAPYVIPPAAFIGQQQYSAAAPVPYQTVNQPLVHYSADTTPEAGGGTVYYDADSQRDRLQQQSYEHKRRPIPIVSPVEQGKKEEPNPTASSTAQ